MSAHNRVSPEPAASVTDEVEEQVQIVELPPPDSSQRERKPPKQTAVGWEEAELATDSQPQQTAEFQDQSAASAAQRSETTRTADWQENEQTAPWTGRAAEEYADQTTDLDEAEHAEPQTTGLGRPPQEEQTTDLQERTTTLLGTSHSAQEQITTTDSNSRPGSAEDAPILTVAESATHNVGSANGGGADSSDGPPLWYTSDESERVAAKVDPVHPQPAVSRPGRMEAEAHHSRAQRPTSGSKGREAAVVIGASESEEGSGFCSVILTAFAYLLVIVFFPFSLVVCIKVVQEYERAVIFRLGRLLSGGAKGPGIFFVLPCIEDYTKIDLRTVTFDIPPQEVLTRDSVTVSVDAVVYYRIYNPTVSVANVANAAHSTQLLAQTTLRNVLGTKNLGEILSDRDQISESMQTALDDATDRWGIKVERVEIKDVRLPIQLQRAMAAEAEAAREARAKVIAAEGEQKASLALKEASDIISESPAALQLRYLQTLNSISAEKNSTIIFPLPIELLKTFVK